MGFANKVPSMPLEAQSLASYLEAVVGFLGPTRGYLANGRTCATEKIMWTWSERGVKGHYTVYGIAL